MLDERDVDPKEVAELFLGQQFPFGAIGEDAPVAHHDHPVDLRKNVGDVVGHHENADSLLRYAAQGCTEFALRGQVEGIGGFVEKQHFGLMDEGAGDHDTPLLAGRHLSDKLRFEVRGLHQLECLVGPLTHFRRDVQVGPESRGGEESGNNGIEAAGDGGALTGEFGGDDAEVGAELRDVPALAAKEAQLGGGRDDGVALAGDGFDQRRFAAAVGAEDGDVFAVGDAEGDVVEDDVVAARDADVAHDEEVGLAGVGQGGIIISKCVFQRAYFKVRSW